MGPPDITSAIDQIDQIDQIDETDEIDPQLLALDFACVPYQNYQRLGESLEKPIVWGGWISHEKK